MKTSGIYVFYGQNNECLYVGSSKNMEERCKQHKHRKVAARIEFFPCPIRNLRSEEEKRIKAMSPSLNKATTISRPDQPSKRGDLRLGILLTAEDRVVIQKAKLRLKTQYGYLTTSAVIRMGIRKLAQP